MTSIRISRNRGFTLIEMMIVVTIIVLATVLGIPSYNEWVQNTKVRNAAESVATGLEKAKAEAVKQNLNIEFVLGPPWVIQIQAGSPNYPSGAVVETSTTEGLTDHQGNVVIVATPTPSDATKVTFNGLGIVIPNASQAGITPPSLTQVLFKSTALTSARQMIVTIGKNGVGSNIRMCDPNLSNKQDPRAC